MPRSRGPIDGRPAAPDRRAAGRLRRGGARKIVVVTGSTRGIGHGIARELLNLGHSVVVGGRSQASTDRATEALGEPDRVLGHPCDVGDPAQVQALWDAATARFGRVDVWVNNAGMGSATQDFETHEFAEMEAVVRTNVLGLMHGSAVAMRGMKAQGHGRIFNMEGLGSVPKTVIAGTALYGSTKAAVRYLTKAMAKEAEGTPVSVCHLSPGMVITDLFLGPDGANVDGDFRTIANVLADRVETVTPFLAAGITSDVPNGVRINWLTNGKIAWRFASSPFRKRDLFAD